MVCNIWWKNPTSGNNVKCWTIKYLDLWWKTTTSHPELKSIVWGYKNWTENQWCPVCRWKQNRFDSLWLKFGINVQNFIKDNILKNPQNLVIKLFERILCSVFVTSISDDIEKMTFKVTFSWSYKKKMTIQLWTYSKKIQILAV